MTKAEYKALVDCFVRAKEKAISLEPLKSQISLDSQVGVLADDIGKAMQKINIKSHARNLWLDVLNTYDDLNR